MIYNNKNSRRFNVFRNIYDSEEFKNALANKETPAAFPFIVDVELTNQCNLQCLFCGQQTMKRQKGFMEEKIFQKVADECALHKTPIRLIRWGEPFLHPQITNFIEYAKNKGLAVHVTTNGQIISEEQMKAIIEAKLDSLIFSFQGADKTEYEIMRNNKQYDILKKNILRMVELRGDSEKPFIHISCTMTDETKEQIDKFVQDWGSVADSVGVGKTNLSRLSLEQIKSLDNLGKLLEVKNRETVKKIYTPCSEVYQKLSVDWNGDVSCCCMDFDDYLTVGNINENSLEEIWNNSEKLKLFRRMLDKNMHKSLTFCSTCYHTYEEF